MSINSCRCWLGGLIDLTWWQLMFIDADKKKWSYMRCGQKWGLPESHPTIGGYTPFFRNSHWQIWVNIDRQVDKNQIFGSARKQFALFWVPRRYSGRTSGHPADIRLKNVVHGLWSLAVVRFGIENRWNRWWNRWQKVRRIWTARWRCF